MSSGLNNLNVWTALALPGLGWPASTDKKVDQSMVVNISMPQPAVMDVVPREADKVLASDDRQPASPHFDGPRLGRRQQRS